jgi:manganese-dependent ADP-ribose/CDP-alcohol diphosphatase
MSILQKYIGTVIAVFSGHDHDGGYAKDENGIHYIVLPAPLESNIGDHTYGIVSFYDNRLDFQWFGRTAKTIQDGLTWPPCSIHYT